MPSGYLRKPRCWVSANGVQIPVLECTVKFTTTQASDTFSASFPMNAVGVSVPFWANTGTIPISIVATNDVSQGGSVTLYTGNVDKVAVYWAERYIFIEGQDPSSVFKSTLVRQNFKNQTHAQIVKKIAGDQGFSANVDDDGKKAGKKYISDYDEITSQQSQWTLLAQLAERAGKVLFFKNNTVYFKDPQNINQGAKGITVVYTPPSPQQYATGNFVDLITERHCELSGEITSTTTSFHPHDNKTVKATKTLSATPSSGAPGYFTPQQQALVRSIPTSGPNAGQVPGGLSGADQPASGSASQSPPEPSFNPASSPAESPDEGGGGSAPSQFDTSGMAGGSPQRDYNIEVPRATQDQVDAIAAKKLFQESSHEQIVTLTNLPGDVTFDVLAQLTLSGTGTSFDQSYTIETLTHSFSQEQYTCDIRAKAANSGRSAS